jgi:hypothetical protein
VQAVWGSSPSYVKSVFFFSFFLVFFEVVVVVVVFVGVVVVVVGVVVVAKGNEQELHLLLTIHNRLETSIKIDFIKVEKEIISFHFFRAEGKLECTKTASIIEQEKPQG